MAYSRGGIIRWLGGERPKMGPFAVDEHNERAVVVMRRSIAMGTPLFVTGPVGAGKTALMLEIDFWLAMRTHQPTFTTNRAWWLESPTNWWTGPKAYANDVREGWTYAKRFSDWSGAYSADGIAAQVPRLFLDDLGTEDDHDVSLLVELLCLRHLRKKPTWITSNLNVPELKARYTERVVSRIFDSCELLTLTGADRRLHKARERQLALRGISA